MKIFTLSTISIVLDAVPFLLLGSLIASAIEVLVPRELLERRIPKNRVLQMFCGLSMGLVLPTCECGIVPVVRRLMKKGVAPRVAMSYMLAAPVVNPLSIVSTYVAFPNMPVIIPLRIGVVVVVAAVTASIIDRMGRHPVKDSPEHPAERTGHAGHADHGSEGAGHGSKTGERIVHLLVHAADEFLSMGAYLIVGAAVAGLLQTAAPAGSLAFFRGSAALSVGFMIALAVVLSICSEADAFVAASFIRFTPAAQLAFLTTGPVVDIKLISMFLGTFRREAVLVLVSVPLIMNFVLCLLLALLF